MEKPSIQPESAAGLAPRATRRLSVIGNTGIWHRNDLLRAAQLHAGWELEFLDFEQLAASVGGSPRGFQIWTGPNQPLRTDAIMLRAMSRGSLEQVILRMDLLGAWYSAGGTVINPPAAIECCIDKFQSLVRLARAGVPVPPTWVWQNPEGWDQVDLHAFPATFPVTQPSEWPTARLATGAWVQKPIFGSEGRGLVRWDEPQEGAKWWRILAQNQQVCYLQAYLDHGGRDYRLLVVGDEVFGLQRARKDDWRLNLSRGAQGAVYRPSPAEQDLAHRCAAICGARVCGVDLVYDRHGAPWILEVNASPGWRGISTVGEVDIALKYLQLFDQA